MESLIIIALGFACHFILLGIVVISWRSVLVLKGDKKSNEFTAGIPHGSDLYWRINRAHINAAENLPAAAIVLFAGYLLSITDENFILISWVYLILRFLHSIIQISGNSVFIVNTRFTLLVLQYICFFVLAFKLALAYFS